LLYWAVCIMRCNEYSPNDLPILIHFPMWAMIEQCLHVVVFQFTLWCCLVVCLRFNIYRLVCFGKMIFSVVNYKLSQTVTYRQAKIWWDSASSKETNLFLWELYTLDLQVNYLKDRKIKWNKFIVLFWNIYQVLMEHWPFYYREIWSDYDYALWGHS
jgi:hypothetical protein